jgi:group II intron reverse transcriptase/maturase
VKIRPEGTQSENGSCSKAGYATADNSAAKSAFHRGRHDEKGRLGSDHETPTDPNSAAGLKLSEEAHPGHTTTKRQQSNSNKGGKQPKLTKAHSLIDKVYSWENLLRAYRRVKANKGAHGLDRVTLRMFDANRDLHLREIQRKLMQNRYVWQPVRRVYIPKSSNPKELRPLGIPTVSDRIVGQALVQVLDPIFDPHMSDRSFAYRNGRSAHDAIATIKDDLKAGFTSVVDGDVKSCFDEISYNVAMSCVTERVADGRVLDLLQTYLKSGVYEDGHVSVPKRGIPQGGALSPLIMNLVLGHLDQEIEQHGYRLVRYADDFVILCRTRQEAQVALALCSQTLRKLGLRPHPTKTRIVNAWCGFCFLGFQFKRGFISVSPQAIDRFKDKVRTLTQRQQGRNIKAVIEDLVPRIRGWARYFGVAHCAQTFSKLDSWIRMRLRGFKFKRRNHNDNWRLPNKKLERMGFLSLQKCRPTADRFALSLNFLPRTEEVAP